jgi:hypothetical protein
MKHLTHTGSAAGQLLCGTTRQPDGDYAHAVYAPLKNAVFREKCCTECLRVWIDSYDEDEVKPEWAIGADYVR